MDYKTGLLVITVFACGYGIPTPEDDYFFFRYDDTKRIVGGTPAAPGSHPHMVALTGGFLVRTFLCGGSLISQRTVLTAAHCIRDSSGGIIQNRNLRVTVGTNTWSDGGLQYRISRGVIHPNYDHPTIKNDIGILITSGAVSLNNNMSPVFLSYEPVGGDVAVRVAGWGALRAGGAVSFSLQEVDLTTIDGQVCVNSVREAAIESNFNIYSDPEIEICTSRGIGLGTCNSDSGSALRRIDNGQQIGIVSWGFPCARGAPDMFVRISAFRHFIQANLV